MALVSNNISDVRLGIANNGIGLYMIVWAETPSGTTSVDIHYRIVGDPTWIVAIEGLAVPSSGIPAITPQIIVVPATSGAQYEVRFLEYGSTDAFVATITVPKLLFGNNYLLDDVLYNICGNNAEFKYSNAKFATGVTMYDDILLTTPISETLISEPSGGDIYVVAAGVIGASTGYGCFYWVAGLYVLGNSTSLCTGEPVVELYTDGEVTETLEGMVLYTDKELTTPVTGYDYVLEVATETIFNLNDTTGEVESETDECLGFYNVLIVNNNSRRVITGVFGIEGFALITTIPVGDSQAGVHTAFEGQIVLVTANGGTCDGCGTDTATLFIDDVSTETIDVQEGAYYFASLSYTGSQIIKIVLNTAP